MSLDAELRSETEKWLRRAEEALEKISPSKVESERFCTNSAAYISDCRYFLDEGDLIRAFEAVIWAWAWIEIGQDEGILTQKDGALSRAE